ncbi:MAG: TonB-dependent receptor [Pseudomonadota bacterium]
MANKHLLSSASAIMIAAIAGPALAQSGDEIIVTATKRPQTLQEVPVAVSVVDESVIEKAQINDLLDLQISVPSLRVTQLQNSSNTNFLIRGFGNGANNPGIEPSVGVFIDGVYRSRTSSAILDLPTLERVEILRGPQSTLFGKNVSAGAISITTKSPDFEWGGSAEATYGNFNQAIFKGTLTGPISETVAFRVSGSINQRDGYYTNILDGTDVNERSRWSARGQLLWEPADDLSFRLIGEYNRIDEICCGAVQVLNGPVTTRIAEPPPVGLGAIIGDDTRPFAREIALDEPVTNELEGKGLSLQADWDLGFAQVTSITAYRDQSDNTQTDADFSSAAILTNPQMRDFETFTQEIRIASVGDNRLDWLVGGFFFDETVEFQRDVIWGPEGRQFSEFLTSLAGAPGALGLIEAATFGPAAVGNTFFQEGQGVFGGYELDNRSYSFFGQFDFHLTDRLTLTGGVSYINDRKEAVSDAVSTDTFSAVDLSAIGTRLAVINLAGVDIATADPSVVQATLAAPLSLDSLGSNIVIDPATGAILTGTSTVGAVGTAIGGTTCFAGNPNLLCNPVARLGGFQFFPPQVNYPDPNNPLDDGLFQDDKVSYTARLAYDLTDSINTYFTYSTGWKAAAVNLSDDSTPPDVNGIGRAAAPEDVTLFEIGMKASFDGGYINIALFDQTIEDFQSNLFVGTGFFLLNAEEQSVRGFEIDSAYSPIEPLLLSFALTYLDPEFDSFTQATCASFIGFTPDGCQPDPVTGFTPDFFDATGLRPAGIHEISLTTSALYTHDFGNGDQGYARVEYLFESDVQALDNIPADVISRKVNVLNASLGYEMENGFSVNVWGRNLTDDEFFLSGAPSPGQAGTFFGYTNTPRTYGVTVRKRF